MNEEKRITKIVWQKYKKETLALLLISVGGLIMMGYQLFQNLYMVAIGISFMLIGNYLLKDYG